ncbi:EamA family transporter [Heliobacterium gestii]|uniref:EamA family transporter n=1 Tax=Heliomicrobium gestii TaxID=2699 RepID=A0A845LHT1_HELGE|nr:DMT family transporter [Heliomicrobium gestii]MBM7868431.1 drug/metabolite transporter (DMT)-like permease [Heliomicrobium gestii]MZP44580.1 EamA family transporter [Heliomicrobium gestii]
MEAHHPVKTYLKLILTTCFWGGTFVAAKLAVQEAPPFYSATCRFTVAALVLFVLVAREAYKPGGEGRIPYPKGWRQILGLFSLGLTGIFFYNACFFTGLKWTTAANGSLVVAINPLVTALFSALLLKERIRPLQAAGFFLSFIGVVTVVSRGSLEVLRGLTFNPGDVILLGAPLSWALYSVLGKKMLGQFSPLVATAYATLFGTALLLPAALIEAARVGTTGGFSGIGWLAILQLALLGTVLGFVWWYEGVKTIGPGPSAIFINLVPVFALIFGVLILHEQVAWPQLAGGALVITGVLTGTAAASAAPKGQASPPGEAALVKPARQG